MEVASDLWHLMLHSIRSLGAAALHNISTGALVKTPGVLDSGDFSAPAVINIAVTPSDGVSVAHVVSCNDAKLVGAGRRGNSALRDVARLAAVTLLLGLLVLLHRIDTI